MHFLDMLESHLLICVVTFSTYSQIRPCQNKAFEIFQTKPVLVMKVWIVNTDKVQSEINILSPIICYNFMSSFISDTYQLALLCFSGILEEDITEKPLSQRFPCKRRRSYLKHKTAYSIWNQEEQNLGFEKPWSFVECLILIWHVWFKPLWLIVCWGFFMMNKIHSKSKPVWSRSLAVYALK